MSSSVNVPWGQAQEGAPEFLPELHLLWIKLLDSLHTFGIQTFIQPWIIYSSFFAQLPKHQWRPGWFQLFDVTSSQVAKEAIKHPIA